MKLRFLEECNVPQFVTVERVAPMSRHMVSALPLRTIPKTTKTRLRKSSGWEELQFSQQPFDIGFASLPNALMWAEPMTGNWSEVTMDGEWMFHEGTSVIFSLDGYTFSDCLFRNRGVPNFIEFDQETCEMTITRSLPANAERVNGECVFLGEFYDHFGHFILESMNRFWFLDYIPEARRKSLRYVFYHTWSDPERSMLWQMLELYGVGREQVIIADRPLLFDLLTVPSPAQRPFIGWQLYYSKTMEACYRGLRERILNNTPSSVDVVDKLYLSRDHYNSAGQGRRSLLNSQFVEERFRDAGYRVVYPETLSFPDQLHLASNATCIAGPSGSAHHLAAFASNRLNSQLVLTPATFFLPIADVSFTMYKDAQVTYLLADQEEDGKIDPTSSLEADWHVDQTLLGMWLGEIGENTGTKGS